MGDFLREVQDSLAEAQKAIGRERQARASSPAISVVPDTPATAERIVEYRTELGSSMTTGVGVGGSHKALSKHLDQLGKDRWDLVTVTSFGAEAIYIFKRYSPA
jgi:hypothetical protein